MSGKKETLVLKLSGSLFFSKKFEPVVRVLVQVLSEKPALRLAVVAGGGSTAREYIRVAEKLGADQASMDEIGIAVSKLNAMILNVGLEEFASSFVPQTLTEVANSLEIGFPEHRAVVLGGLHPGQSTNAVAALVAEKLRAKVFVNATDVDAVYTKDPNKFKDAEKLDRVTPSELSKILGTESMRAGAYDLMDPVALKLIERSRIRTWIISCDALRIKQALLGKNPAGTEVVFDR
jgi:uridylate kinase